MRSREDILSKEEEEITIMMHSREYRIKDIYEIYNVPSILKKFYNSLIKQFGGLPTISPIYDEKWAIEAAKWLSEGEIVAELGCGDGTFALKVLDIKDKKIKKFYLIDFSDDVLEEAKKRIKAKICEFSKSNIEYLEIKDNTLDRIISINTYGDTRVEPAFRESYRVLKEGGLLRGTLYSKETYDMFWKKEKNRTYFSTECMGIWFTPIDFYKGPTEPMGCITLPPKNEKIEFVRVQRYYTKDKWLELLKNVGFKIISCKLLVYPKEMVIERWGKSLTEEQKEFIYKHNGFPECWDVIAQK